MSNEKKSFVLYHSFAGPLHQLSMQDRGLLITAIFDYVCNGCTAIKLKGSVGMAFAFIKEALDRDRLAYEERCQINARNAKKGGRPRKNDEDTPKETEKTERFSKKPKKPDNDNDNENENENEIDNDNENENENENEKSIPLSEHSVGSAAPQNKKENILNSTEIKILESRGVPESYYESRLERARQCSLTSGRRIIDLLYEWWEHDNKRGYRDFGGKTAEQKKKDDELDEWFERRLAQVLEK